MYLNCIAANEKMNRLHGIPNQNFNGDSTDSRNSVNSSFADLLEASDVVIRDQYEGSIHGLPYGCNIVTSNLQKCKNQMIFPYYKMLSLIAWRPFAANTVRFQCFWSFINFLYPVFIIALLMVWYIARVWTCQGRLSMDQSKPTVAPTTIIPTTITPTPNATNWSSLIPAQRLNKSESPIGPPASLKPTNCHHLFGTYIVPDILYFIAYIIGFYHFRVQESEGLCALMEKVYLQSTNPQQITRMLRLNLYIGFLWLLLSTGLSVYFHYVFGLASTTGIHHRHKIAQYGVAAMLVVAECAANCVIISVVISHGSQCQLLKYYLDGIMNRLEEKSTELRFIMKDILDVRQNLARINGLLAFNTACVVFNISLMALVGFILLVTNRLNEPDLWIYRSCFFILWTAILAISVIQPARFTANGERLKDTALVIRVFGYHTHTQLDIDSFLNFLNLVDLKAKLFTIPVKPPYLWGVVVIATQVMILVVQMGDFVPDNIWF
eukprot:Seg550.9_Seg550.7 transcript_id=Seg550.9_Seg550.7/GoldUCD/mRNA.D3Y31 product="hypothetical protein" pseudo=true protein_id=Seg550.9_Seg550.7/GoldUCD/D3Y31